MSDFFENNQENIEQSPADDTVSEVSAEENVEEESTVFSAPVEHKDRTPKKGNKKRMVSVIAAIVAVAILIGGTIAVIKFIPELEEDEVASSIFEDISLIDKDSSTFTTVNITNTNGTFKFISKEITYTDEDGNTDTTTHWGVEDIDVTKMSTDSMTSVISSAASITAIREISTKTASECGLDEPIIKVSVEDATNGSFGFVVGDSSTDGLGNYFMIDGDDKIYVVPTSELSAFQFNLVDLSDKTAIPATIFSTDTSEYTAEDGSYAYFDSLTLSGKLYGTTITIENNNEDSASASIIPYIITTPTKRFAQSENITPLITLFSNSISVSGNYAFDITDQTLKEFGLDDPDAVLTMTINGESKYFKFSVIDSDYCAVVYDDATMIRKVDFSLFAFLSLAAEDFYDKHPFMYSINDVSTIELIDSEGSIEFDISSSLDEDSNTVYTVLANGTEIVASDFQTFYADFVGTQCNSFEVTEVSGEAESTISFVFNDGSSTTVKFYKIGETKYQYSVDDVQMGNITSSAYRKLIRNIKAQAEVTEAE